MTNAEVYECMNKALGGVVKLNTNAMKLGKLLSTLGYQRDKQGNQRGWKIRYKSNFNRPADEGKPLPYID